MDGVKDHSAWVQIVENALNRIENGQRLTFKLCLSPKVYRNWGNPEIMGCR